jgi:catechol 2,3-dioxygenase-like lactoylglutathione lyase family enzyme
MGVRCAGVVLPVRDVARSARFYAALLGLPPSDGPVLHIGAAAVQLRQRDDPAVPRASNDTVFRHMALVVQDIPAAQEVALAAGGQATSFVPQRLPAWNPAASGIAAWYFRDPDGHPLELIHFPPGKGSLAWQEPSDRLVLGIDHMALVAEDTVASLEFYRGLGFRVSGHSVNLGPEQEALSGVPGAAVLITSLAGSSGLGLELLQYLRPGTLPASGAGCRAATLIPGYAGLGRDPSGHLIQDGPC